MDNSRIVEFFLIFACTIMQSCTVKGQDSIPAHFRNEIRESIILLESGALADRDFSETFIAHLECHWSATVENCRFRDSYIKLAGFEGYCANCDFTNCRIGGGILNLPQENLVQLKNFQERRFTEISFGQTSLKGVDLTGFEFSHGQFDSLDLSESRLQNVLFAHCYLPNLTQEQFCATRNYAQGNFFDTLFHSQMRLKKVSLRGMFFGSHRHSSPLVLDADSDLTDAVFVNVDLSGSELTLEQIKTTWNYQADAMALARWPEWVEKELKIQRQKAPQYYLPGRSEAYYSAPKKCFLPARQTFLRPEDQNLSNRVILKGQMLCSFENIPMNACVFIDCDLTESKNLSFEQVKKTWNYKTGRMSLCKWPKHIEKALEEEEEEKAKEEE